MLWGLFPTQRGRKDSTQLEAQAKIPLSIGVACDGLAQRFDAPAENALNRPAGARDGLPLFQVIGLFPKDLRLVAHAPGLSLGAISGFERPYLSRPEPESP